MNDIPCLCVTARFLGGTYHGRDRDGEPEWPPSPLRLFQALVAAAGRQRTADETDALRWLESQPAPAVVAPPMKRSGSLCKTYVPNNDVDRQTDRVASRVEKAYRPLHLPERAEVQYRWPIRPEDRPHAESVVRLAGRLRCLGWGIDTVAGRGGFDCAEPKDAERHVAGNANVAGKLRRVPIRGTLASLDKSHADAASRFDAGRYRPSDANVTARTVAYQLDDGLPRRPVLAFSLVDIKDGSRASVWPSKVAEVAGQVRHAAKRAAGLAGWDEETIRTYVCGHDVADGRRLAYLPLPSVGHRHTDGMIRRVLIVFPPGDDARLGELRPRLIGALHPEEGDPTTAMVPCPPGDKVLHRYAGDGRTWASVTPAILPGHTSRRGLGGDPFELTADDLNGGASTSVGRKAAKVVTQMLEHAGVPLAAVDRIVLTRTPLIPNLPHAMRFRPPATLEKYQRTHVRLVLNRSAAGPLSLGLGRYRGFGTLVAI